MIFMRENSISFTVAKLQTCEEYFKTDILLLVLVMQILRVKIDLLNEIMTKLLPDRLLKKYTFMHG